MKEITVGLGYLACFLFFPSYPLLVVGVKVAKKTTVLATSLVSAFLVFVVQLVLEEARVLDVCILFVASYFASKPFRFLVVGLLAS